jgi:AcrR family transcriptional regulator
VKSEVAGTAIRVGMAGASTPAHRRRPSPGNPRVQHTRARILAVARELLAQVGPTRPTGLTYALPAERADVTRQALYRHWSRRAALLFDLMFDAPGIGDHPEPSDDVPAAAAAPLRSLRADATVPAMRTALPAVLARADRHGDGAQALARIREDRRPP